MAMDKRLGIYISPGLTDDQYAEMVGLMRAERARELDTAEDDRLDALMVDATEEQFQTALETCLCREERAR